MLRASFGQKFFLLLADAIFFLVLNILLVEFLISGATMEKILISPGFWFVQLSLLVSSYVFGVYEISEMDRRSQIFRRVFVSFFSTLLLVVTIHYLGAKERSGVFSRPVFISALTIHLVWSYSIRLWFRQILQNRLQRQRWLFLVAPSIVEHVRADLQPLIHLKEKVFVTEFQDPGLLEQVKEPWTAIIVGTGAVQLPSELTNLLVKERFRGKKVMDLVGFYESTFLKIPVFALALDWFSFTQGFRLISSGIFVRLKRLSDVILSGFFLFLFSPVMLMLWILIPLESRGSAVYRQKRTGKNGKNFELMKFRSMLSDAEASGPQWAKANDKRITRIGGWLRKTRLDELPQLWNILKGEMSLVGPRPERPEFNEWLEKEIPFYQFRHEVRPGLTGWAQINYPYGASKQDALEKLQFELFYMKNSNLWLDFVVLIKTVNVVIFRMGR